MTPLAIINWSAYHMAICALKESKLHIHKIRIQLLFGNTVYNATIKIATIIDIELKNYNISLQCKFYKLLMFRLEQQNIVG